MHTYYKKSVVLLLGSLAVFNLCADAQTFDINDIVGWNKDMPAGQRQYLAYRALEIEPTDNIKVINAAYRKATLKYHPDKIKKGESKETRTANFQIINNINEYFNNRSSEMLGVDKREAEGYALAKPSAVPAVSGFIKNGLTRDRAGDRTKRIDKMKGAFYASADKKLLKEHNDFAALVEMLSNKFGSLYSGPTIRVPDPKYKQEYIVIIDNALKNIKDATSSLQQLASEKAKNNEFQDIRKELFDDNIKLEQELNALKIAIRST
jgi:hypothetical protein